MKHKPEIVNSVEIFPNNQLMNPSTVQYAQVELSKWLCPDIGKKYVGTGTVT